MNYSAYTAGILAFCVFQSNAAERTMTLEGKGVCQDGHAWSSRPSETRGSYYFIDARAWTWNRQGDGPGITRSFFACDLSGLPPTAKVVRAVLGLYQDQGVAATNETAQHSTMSGSNELVVQRIISPWSERDISWDTQPATTDRNQVIVPASTSPLQDYRIDVTPLLQDALDHHDMSLGMAIKLLHEQPYRAVTFSSNDNTDPDSHPRLVITYEPLEEAAAPTQGHNETTARDRRSVDLPVDDDREPVKGYKPADRSREPMLEWTPKTGQ